MIEPKLKDDALLADIAAARREPDRVHLWWLGQSGVLVQARGRHLLLDPYLSDSLTDKYASTDKPHVRMTERVVEPRRLDFIDVVTSSHNHTDHLDAETLVPILDVNPHVRVVVPAANRQFAAERLHVDRDRLDPIDDGESLAIAGFAIHAVPAAHEQIERDEEGRCKFLGYIVEVAGRTLYHSGDTMLYEGMVERLRQWSIDVAILPINGRVPERRVAGNLWGREAAQVAHDAGIRAVVPCHYDMFEFNTVSPEEFVREAESLGQRYRVLSCGERMTL